MKARKLEWIKAGPLSKDSALGKLAMVAATGGAIGAIAAVGVPEVSLELPDLRKSPQPKDKAEILLHSAAEIEHALLVQYLYAAYSLKGDAELSDPAQRSATSTWRRAILGIAKEEMGHLMSVQNLLLFTGLQLNFERED